MSKVIIMQVDKKNLNGNIYTKEAIEEMVKKYKDKPIYGFIGMDSDRNKGLNEASHLIKNIEIVEDNVVADIEIRAGHSEGDKLQSMLGDVVFRPQGDAIVDEEGVVSHYDINSINAIDKNEDALDL